MGMHVLGLFFKITENLLFEIFAFSFGIIKRNHSSIPRYTSLKVIIPHFYIHMKTSYRCRNELFSVMGPGFQYHLSEKAFPLKLL